ncbi:MAG: hypothetical protein D6785_08470, partial [Planctomycetota bacterium]
QKLLEVLDVKLQKANDTEKNKILWKKGEILWKKGKKEKGILAFLPLLDQPYYLEKAWPLVSQYYKEKGQWKEYSRFLETYGPFLSLERADWQIELAKIYFEKLEDREASRQILENLLAMETSLEGLELLEQVYSDLGEERLLAELLVEKASLISNKGETLLKAARLFQSLGDERKRLEVLEEAALLDPSTEIWKELKEVYEKNEDYPKIVRVLEELYQREGKREYLRELSKIYLEKLDDKDKALVSFEKLRQTGEGSLEVLESLSHLYLEKGDIYRSLEIEKEKLGLFTKEEQVIHTLEKIIFLYENKLQDPFSALSFYEELFHYLASNKADQVIEVFQKLKDLYLSLGYFEKALNLFKVIEKEEWPSNEKQKILLKKGRILLEEMGRRDEGVEILLQAYDLEPSEQTLFYIKGLFEDLNEWDGLVQLLERKEKSEKGLSAETHLELARIYGKRLSQCEKSISHYFSALETSPSLLREIKEEIISFLKKEKKLADLERFLHLYGKEISQEDQGKILLFLGREILLQGDSRGIHFLEEGLGMPSLFLAFWKELYHYYSLKEDEEKVFHLYQRLIQEGEKLQPHQWLEFGLFALDRGLKQKAKEAIQKAAQDSKWIAPRRILAQLCREEGDLEGEKRFLLEIFDLVEGRSKIPLVHRLSEIALSQENWEEANYFLQEGFHLNPLYAPFIKGLEKLSEKLGDWNLLYDALQRELQISTSSQKSKALMERLFRLSSEHLKSPQKAIHWAQKLLEMEENHPKALAYLMDHWKEKGEWEKLTAALEGEFHPEFGSHYLSLAHFWEDKELQKSYTFYEKAYQANPSHEIGAKILSISRELGMDEKREKIWLDLLKNSELTAEERSTILFELAQYYWKEHGNREKALEYLQTLLIHNPGHIQGFELIKSILTRFEEWKKLSAFYLSLIHRTYNTDLQGLYYFELGELLEDKLGNQEKALACYRRAIQLNPLLNECLDRLIQAYKEQRDNFRVIEFLEWKLGFHLEKEEEKKIRHELATLYLEEGLGSLGIQHLEKILALEPENLEAKEGLVQIYLNEENLDKALPLLEELLSSLEGEKLGQMAWQGGHLALTHFQFEKSRILLEKAFQNLPFQEELAEDLVRVYQELERDQDLKKIYSLLIEKGPSQKAGFYHYERGKILENQGDLLAAQKDFERSISLDPSFYKPLLHLKNIYKELSQFQKLAFTYERLVPFFPEKESFYLYKSGKYYSRIKSWDKAYSLLKKALEKEPKNIDILDRLLEALKALHKDEERIEYLKWKSEISPSKEARGEALQMAARLCVSLERYEEAFEIFRILNKEYPEKYYPEEADLLSKLEKWEELAELLEKAIGITKAPLVKSELLVERGQILWNQLQREDEAYQSFLKALELDPQSIPAMEWLRNFYREKEQEEDYAQLTRRAGEAISEENPSQGAQLFYELGDYYMSINIIDKAEIYFQEALEKDSSHIPSLLA